jgi:hypothetical protein
VQRVTSYESLATSAVTPVENVLDNEPTVSNSKQVANQIGSITYNDKRVERPFDKTDVITNGLYVDINDLSLDLRT